MWPSRWDRPLELPGDERWSPIFEPFYTTRPISCAGFYTTAETDDQEMT
jgi:hypothetical protein